MTAGGSATRNGRTRTRKTSVTDWDKKYAAGGERLFGDAPNEYVRAVLARSDFDARSALCLGDGDGRNGGWLALQGLAVTAVDISGVATEQALEHDRTLGVTTERIVADLADWRPEAGRSWDAVFMLYLQCEAPVRHRAAVAANAALAAGGWFVAEGFTQPVGEEPGLGPKEPELLYDLDALVGALPGFRLIEAFRGTTWMDQGLRHRGTAHVVRLLARRAGNS